MEEQRRPAEVLALAEWRRQMSELYAEVRRLAAGDPERAHAVWRETREALYRGHSQSPVPADQRAAFRARHFPYDTRMRFEPVVEPDGASQSDTAASRAATPFGGLQLPVSVGTARTFDRIGWVELPLPEGVRRLAVFWLRDYAGGLFLPFRDGTNGSATYGAGRYLLDTAKGADLGPGALPGSIVVDFNFAFQPSCAFDPRWSCPLAPPENRLDVGIEAGERVA